MTRFKSSLHIKYESIVIGETIESLKFALQNNFPLISAHQPLIYDLEFPNHGKDLIKETGELKHHLTLSGKYFYSPEIFVETNNKAVRVTKNNFTITFFYQNLFVFDDQGVNGLPAYHSKYKKGEYHIVDWFALEHNRRRPKSDSAGVDVVDHSLHYEYPSRFMSDLFFYPRKYIIPSPLRESRRNVVAFSYLYEKEIQQPDYSPGIIRIFLDDLVNKQLKVPGQKRYDRGPGKRFPITVAHERRDIIRLEKNIYEDTGDITFMIRQNYPILEQKKESFMSKYYTMYKEETEYVKSFPHDRGGVPKRPSAWTRRRNNPNSKKPKVLSE